MRTLSKTIVLVLGTGAALALASQATAQVRQSRSHGGYQRSRTSGFSVGVNLGSRPHYVQDHRPHYSHYKHHRPHYSHYKHHRPIYSHYRRPAPWHYSHRGHLYSRPSCGRSRGVFVVPSCGASRSGYAVPGRSVSWGSYRSPSFGIGISWGGRSSSRHHRR